LARTKSTWIGNLEMIIDMQCSAIDQCAEGLIDLMLPGMDCDTYFGNALRDGEWPNIEQAVADGTVVYDGTKIQACIDAWEAAGCDIFVSRAPEVCEEALAGTVEEGGQCTLNVECKGPLFCQGAPGCPGTCTARQPEGSGCDDSDACESGLTCDDALKKCVAPSAAGEACGSGEPECELGLFCQVDEEAGGPGTCMEMSDVLVNDEGDPCAFESGGWCKEGLSCVLENWTASGPEASCQAQVGSGEACGIGIPSQCPPDEYCNADPQGSGTWTGECVPKPVDGEECADYGAGPVCAPYHVCDSGGTCREMDRLDGDCSENLECYSGYCEGGKCAPVNSCMDLSGS